jgi:hypothetical protein
VQGVMDISGRLHELLFIQMTLKNLHMAVVNNFLYDSLAKVDLLPSMMFFIKIRCVFTKIHCIFIKTRCGLVG